MLRKRSIASRLLPLAAGLALGAMSCALAAERDRTSPADQVAAPAAPSRSEPNRQTPVPGTPARAATNSQVSVTARAPSRVALVIGNSAYDALPPLTSPANDAQDVCTKLKSLNFDATCQFDIPDRIHVREILRVFLDRARQARTVVFYFSGHGVQVDGENYLLPTKVTPLSSFDLKDEGLALGPLLKSLAERQGANAPGASVIVIVDAARDNTLEERQIAKGSRGLARVETSSPQLLLLLSAAPGGTVRDTGARNSLFARELLRNLGEPGITISEAFQRTRDQVQRDAAVELRTEQVPLIIGSLDARFCMAGCEESAPAPANEEVNKQLNEALRRIRELEADKVRNANERQESAQLVAKLEGEVLAREKSAATVTEQDRQKEAELADLRAQLANAKTNQRQLDQMGTAVQKAKELQEANVRLSQEKQDAEVRVAKLQGEIDARAYNAGQAGELNKKSQEEIARLRAELDEARAKQRQVQEAESRAKVNDVEISSGTDLWHGT